jgi:hypothetical protein
MHLLRDSGSVMAGQKRQRVRAKRGPMTGSARLRADVPAIHVFNPMSHEKTWMPGIADKFTPSAQGRLLWPRMTITKT